MHVVGRSDSMPSLDHERGVLLNRLRSFIQFVKNVVLQVFNRICREDCGRRRCRDSDWSPWSSGIGSGRPEEDDLALPPSTTARPPPQPQPQPHWGLEEGYYAAAGSHRKFCWEGEADETQCLNGGSCFAIELHNGMRRSGCSCTPEWTGERCEMRYIDPILWEDSDDYFYRSASVSFEMCALIIIVFAVLTAVYIYLRQRRLSPLQRLIDDSSLYRRTSSLNPSASDLKSVTPRSGLIDLNDPCHTAVTEAQLKSCQILSACQALCHMSSKKEDSSNKPEVSSAHAHSRGTSPSPSVLCIDGLP